MHRAAIARPAPPTPRASRAPRVAGEHVRFRSVDDPDGALVRQAMAGDLAAFEALVVRHQAAVLRVTTRILGPEEAEDAAQDALLRAFHRLPRFRGEAPFRNWLLRIAHNTALNALARRVPEPVGEPFELARAGVDPPASLTPAEALEVSERRERLRLKIRQLTPVHRDVLVLRDLEGLSYEEIAVATDAPLGSVKGRLHRARGELIELLRHNTYDWELPR